MVKRLLTPSLPSMQTRRKGALGFAALGMALIFLGSISLQTAMVGAAMVVGGLFVAAFWSLRIKRLKGNPWDYDPELDGPDPHNRHNLDDTFEHDDDEPKV